MKWEKEAAVWSLIYFFAVIVYYITVPQVTAVLLVIVALATYIYRCKLTKNYMDPQGIFALSWIGGQGIACLQLSCLQQEWTLVTWLCFGLSYLGFVIGFRHKNKIGAEYIHVKCRSDYSLYSVPLRQCMIAILCVSVVAFLVEVYIVGYVPLFVDFPHAYSYFHVSGVHYFTVSYVFVPTLSVLYLFSLKERKPKEIVLSLFCNIIAFVIPVLSVSRFQLLFEVGFAVIVYFLLSPVIKWRTVFVLAVCLCVGYGMLSVFRNHNVEYLNSIFEMKDSNIPIVVSQPYMYIVNNYENFNCLVDNLAFHTWGLKMLFPLFALTGLKFIFPQLVNFPVYVTKNELNTYTMFYDAYYDFGIIGVLALAVVIGIVFNKLCGKLRESNNPVFLLLYGQMLLYLGLSFFTTWFSLATTWFWFALTLGIFLYIRFYENGYSVRGIFKAS